MIKYNLICAQGHEFEAWFDNIASFEKQQKQTLLSCPFCDDTTISRAIMAPSIGKKSNQHHTDKAMHVMQKIKQHVQTHFDYVGDGFAEEARAIHYGEKQKRDIYGEASIEDTKELIDEGVPVAPLPGGKRVEN